jgi:pSer/pThr/pTyr-binding forkhead associated (FHA) protein
MQLIIKQADGKRSIHTLEEAQITFGRGSEADIQVSDDKVSRVHCGIRFWDDAYYLKDLTSRNGTYLNGEEISDVTRIKPGDVIRIGGIKIYVEVEAGKGTETILHEVEEEFEHGKGYNTILREIVQNTDRKPDEPQD